MNERDFVEYGDALHKRPLENREFRWRPYGYVERKPPVYSSGERGPILGQAVMAILKPTHVREDVARRRGEVWTVRQQWRDAVEPFGIAKRWERFGFFAGIFGAALVFLVVLGLELRIELPTWVPIVGGGLGFLVAYLVTSRIGARRATRRAEETRNREGFGSVWMTLESGGGYERMLSEFDRVAEEWSRGRVSDQAWTDVRDAVEAAILEFGDHATPADKANREWMQAMKQLDAVLTNLGQQGIG